MKPFQTKLLFITSLALVTAGCQTNNTDSNDESTTADSNPPVVKSALVGEYTSPINFDNPYANVPAQCYIETGNGRQNACLFCHTNGLYNLGLGNNNPQAGAIEAVNFQIDYGFDPVSTTAPYATINRWENTLYPEKLAEYVSNLNITPDNWDMQSYIRTDNWQKAYDQRLGSAKDWDSGYDHPMRLLPGLNPADLPADDDGFVRSQTIDNGFFSDNQGYITGWRAVNFMPYGIFTPINGSVSGIYIRLPAKFMQNTQGEFDLTTYQTNLDLLAQAITDNLGALEGTNYIGNAADENILRGAYPKGTEFAHPLHYVDIEADGLSEVSQFPGTRAQRVKEVRYMYKVEDYNPTTVRPGTGEGDSIYGSDEQGWVNNGAGWILAGFIEDAQGALRPQNREELTQCIGCHSGFKNTEFPNFTSGTGNTVDSTWAFPRKLPGAVGWQEMNYLGFTQEQETSTDEITLTSTIEEPMNKHSDQGEFGLFLNYVVGASLYGDMPELFEQNFHSLITTENGYAHDWPTLDTSSAEAFEDTNQTRQTLLRSFVTKGDYLNEDNTIKSFLLYPTKEHALASALRYRQVVVTQRYQYGKDVFEQTPVTYRHHRLPAQEALKIDGSPYTLGEVISERSVQLDQPARFDYRAGDSVTLIDKSLKFEDGGTYFPEYVPFIQMP
ncbi:MAG: hypothetical protein U9R28_09105 [Pseudomonadota bacterium]|nr:hypothetical protein [Pseudomonadota bacterium]